MIIYIPEKILMYIFLSNYSLIHSLLNNDSFYLYLYTTVCVCIHTYLYIARTSVHKSRPHINLSTAPFIYTYIHTYVSTIRYIASSRSTNHNVLSELFTLQFIRPSDNCACVCINIHNIYLSTHIYIHI